MRAAIPSELREISETRSWLVFLRCWLVLGLLEATIWGFSNYAEATQMSAFVQAPIWLVLWCFTAWAMVSLFVLGHDCGHLAFSKHKWVNVLVGHICLSPLLTGYYNWKFSHDAHHYHSCKRGRDPDWAEQMATKDEQQKEPWHERLRLRLAFGSPVGLMFGFEVGAFRRAFMGTCIPHIRLNAKKRQQVIISNVCVAIVLTAIIGGLYVFGGWTLLIQMYLAPVLIGMATGAFLTFCHHNRPGGKVWDDADWTPFRGAVLGTIEVRFPRLLEWFWLDINVHLPHHVDAKIPWYHLRAASERLKAAFPEYHQSYDFSFATLFDSWRKPWLVRRGDEYVMEGLVDPSKQPGSEAMNQTG